MVDQSDMWKNRQREQGATNPFGYTLEVRETLHHARH